MTGNQPDRRAVWRVGAALVLVVTVLVVLRDGPSTSEDPSFDPVATDATHGERVRRTFTALEDAWDARDRVAFLIAAGPSARSQEWAGQTYDALASLDADEIGLHHVAHPESDDDASGAFSAEVAVSWQPGIGPDPQYRTSSATVRMRMADRGVDVVVLGTNAPSDRTDGAALPLWLAGELTGSRTPQARCLGIDTDPREIACARLARVALKQLAAVLPPDLRTRTGGLLIVFPATLEQAAALLGRDPAALSQIAAVSTTVDASGASDAPQLVVLNPERFVPLGPRERQLVVTHESVHVATGAAAVVLPVWVREGFADYVALRTGQIPVRRAVEQALDRVRRVGPPRSLPRDADFHSARLRLGVAYQQAWSAFRLLGERHGAGAVVGFYTAVLDGARVGPALEDAFSITRAELTAAWHADLVRLAG